MVHETMQRYAERTKGDGEHPPRPWCQDPLTARIETGQWAS